MAFMRISHTFFSFSRKKQGRNFVAATISAKDANVLREQNSAPIVDCKNVIVTIRRYLRSFIKVVHPDVTPLATYEQKKRNEESLGELNNFLDLTDTLCNSTDAAKDNDESLNLSPVSKFGINQTKYNFLFHVPLVNDSGNDSNAGVDNNGNIYMKELKVKIQLPDKIFGLKSLNDNQKLIWLGFVANGTIDLLNGAKLDIGSDLQKLQLLAKQYKSNQRQMKNGNFSSTNNESSIHAEEDEFLVDGIDFESLINEQINYYEKYGFQNVKESSQKKPMRSKQLYKKFYKPKQRYKRIRKIIENGLYLTDDINDLEANEARDYYSKYLYDNFYDLQVWNNLWDNSRVCILKGIDKAEIFENEGVLCLPFDKEWGGYENELILQFIVYGSAINEESMPYNKTL
jgi:hypothetical protein